MDMSCAGSIHRRNAQSGHFLEKQKYLYEIKLNRKLSKQAKHIKAGLPGWAITTQAGPSDSYLHASNVHLTQVAQQHHI
jgi:hypothetical protein